MGVQCPTCGKWFHRRHFSEHIRIHTGEKPFICEFCQKAFAAKSNLTDHRKKHLGETFSCTDCNRQFSQRSLLTRHKQNAENPSQFKCDQCCSSFAKKSNLNSHLLKIHNISVEQEELESHSESPSDQISREPSILDKKSASMSRFPTSSKNNEDHNNDSDDDIDVIYGTQVEPTAAPLLNPAKGVHLVAKKRKATMSAPFKQPKNKSLENQKTSGSNVQEDDDFFESSQQTDRGGDAPAINIPSNPPQHLENHPQDPNTDLPGPQLSNSNALSNNPTRMDRPMSYALNEKLLKANAPTTEVEIIAKTSPVRSDAIQTITTVKDFDVMFIADLWKFTKGSNFVKETMENFMKGSDNFGYAIISFLFGKPTTLKVSEMAEVFMMGPEKLIGKFAAALLVLDYSVILSTSNLIDFYMQTGNVSQEIRQVVEKVVIHRIQKSFQTENLFEEVANMIPDNLRNKINFDFLNVCPSQGKDLCDQLLLATMRIEKQVLSEITDLLMALLFKSIDSQCASLLEFSFPMKERVESWSFLVTEYMNCYLENENAKTVFDTLLLSDFKRNIGTMIAQTVQVNGENVLVRIHKGVLERYCEITRCEEGVVEATADDVETIQKLFYQDYQSRDYVGKISMAVFQLAKNLKVKDVWWFLFRGESYDSFMTEDTKKDILQILISVKKEEAIQQIAKQFKNWLPREKISTCLNGLSNEDVKYFLAKKDLQLDEIDVYRMLIQWSFSKSGRSCQDELKAEFAAETFENFKLVREVLYLLDLRDYFGQLFRQKYVTWEDIKMARYFIQNEGKSALDHQMKPWFPVGSRKSLD